MRASLLALLAIGLMMLDAHFLHFKTVRAYFLNFTSPIQHMVNWPIAFVCSLKESIVSKRSLLQENEILRAEQLLLQAKVQRLISLEQENVRLRGLTDSVIAKKDRFLIAQLLAVNASDFSSSLILDKGEKDGVYIGQPVLDADGLAGQVIEVGARTCLVLLITDVKSAIPVQINRNGLRAIALGSGDGSALELIQIPITVDVKEGELLVTSGLGSRFPQGYPVGVISKIQHIPGERFTKIFVEPKARVNGNRHFLLLWPSHLNLQDTKKNEQ